VNTILGENIILKREAAEKYIIMNPALIESGE